MIKHLISLFFHPHMLRIARHFTLKVLNTRISTLEILLLLLFYALLGFNILPAQNFIPFFLQESRGAKMWLLMRYRGYMTAVICVIIFCMLLVFQTPVDEVSEGMCACKDCVRQQTHSFWFNELYDLSIQPLRTREN